MWRNGVLCWPHRRVETALGEGFYFLRIFYTTTLTVYIVHTLKLYIVSLQKASAGWATRKYKWQLEEVSCLFQNDLHLVHDVRYYVLLHSYLISCLLMCQPLPGAKSVEQKSQRPAKRSAPRNRSWQKYLTLISPPFSWCIVSQLNGRGEFLYTFEGTFEFTLLNLDSRPL